MQFLNVKKTYVIVLALLLLPGIAFASALGAVSATGAGVLQKAKEVTSEFGIFCALTDADTSVTDIDVVFEVTADGTTFIPIATHNWSTGAGSDLAAKKAYWSVTSAPTKSYRLNLTTYASGEAAVDLLTCNVRETGGSNSY